jgi:RNA-directed DNA polymerase
MTICNVTSVQHLAVLLGLPLNRLTFILYKIPDGNKYRLFEIDKKNGGKRVISAPIKPLRDIQKTLFDLLKTEYKVKQCSHGFEKDRSFITNASAHKKSKILLNIDISGYFESINFGRVRGLFLAKPFVCSPNVATILAQIICHNNALPQGACTSPLIANMISRKLDSTFIHLAKQTGSRYTRYVDDITFSTTKRSFAKSIVESYAALPSTNVLLGKELSKIVVGQGFIINHKKTRIQDKTIRQEVTGVVINEFNNVRREFIRSIRMMLHMWRKFGLSNAAAHFRKSVYKKTSKLTDEELFRAVLIGKISHLIQIRGRIDSVLYGICSAYIKIDPNPPKIISEVSDMSKRFKVFIGHAGEDKKLVALPLHDELEKLGIKTFIDAVEINWGDSITQVINKALGEADIFVAVISTASKSKLWPQKEVNAAIARTIAGKQTFLPIFVGTPSDVEQLQRHYALISDILFKRWENNPSELAAEIQRLV